MKKRIKEICSFLSRGTSPDYVDESPYKVMNQATFSKGWLDESNVRFTKKPTSEANIKKGDLLMASTGGGVLGKVFFYNSDDSSFYADSHVSILRDSRGRYLMKYLYYYFSTRYDEINATMVKGSTNQTELQKNYLLAYEIDIPSLTIQQKIITFLDSKTAEIDNQISLLSKKRDAYMRLKKSIIHCAVTHGLNPDVEMKESGVDWIGMIPKHWEIRLLKNMMTIHNGRDYKHIEVDDPEEGYPVIGSGGPFAFAKEKMYSGEALLLGRKGTIDKPLYWHGSFWTVDTMFYAKPSNLANCKYMYYLSLNFPFRKIGTQTALPSMTQTALNCLEVSCPPLTEQQTIADYLDEKTAKIDAVVSNLDQQIEKYKLLKRALINEVVTGQRAV